LSTHNPFGLARLRGARFMLAFTSEVYGDPLVHPQPEEYRGNVNQVGVRGVYDQAKRYAESITMAYRHHLDTRIVRIFNPYGSRMRPDDRRMVPKFIRQALSGRPLTVRGERIQTRGVHYVDDRIEGCVRLVIKSEESPLVNIGNPHEVRMLEMASSESQLINEGFSEYDQKRKVHSRIVMQTPRAF
jgi:dTDP-glucose 4,6-dehydratase